MMTNAREVDRLAAIWCMNLTAAECLKLLIRKTQGLSYFDAIYTAPDLYGHNMKLYSFKMSVGLKFMITLQNLITTNHRKSGKSNI